MLFSSFLKKINILWVSVLDLEENLDNSINKKNVHGDYQAVKNKNDVIAFLQSDGEKLQARFSDFNYPEELLSWFKFRKDETKLFLTGPSGTGKTEGLINLFKDLNPILITDVNALKDLNPEHKAIIFDDMPWDNIARETKLHLLKKSKSSSIKIIYQTVKLKPELVKAVVSNNSSDLISIFDKDKAIHSRISHVKLEGPIFNLIK